jgi:nickel-type superoxide dismutase maturation protease
MFQLLRVSGHSLEPLYQDGDFVVIGKIPIFFRWLRPGNEIVFRHPEYGTLIKRVESVTAAGEISVIGTQPASVDSRRFGPIRREAIIGKVIWRIKRRRVPR